MSGHGRKRSAKGAGISGSASGEKTQHKSLSYEAGKIFSRSKIIVVFRVSTLIVPLSMFAGCRTVFQRVARSTICGGVAKKALTTAIPQTANKSSLLFVQMLLSMVDTLGCRGFGAGVLRWLPDV